MWFSFSTKSGFDQNSLSKLDIVFLAFFLNSSSFGGVGLILSFRTSFFILRPL